MTMPADVSGSGGRRTGERFTADNYFGRVTAQPVGRFGDHFVHGAGAAGRVVRSARRFRRRSVQARDYERAERKQQCFAGHRDHRHHGQRQQRTTTGHDRSALYVIENVVRFTCVHMEIVIVILEKKNKKNNEKNRSNFF